MRRTVPPSAEIEEQIDQLLPVGVGENPREALSELARLGARLIIQRAVRTSSRPGWVVLAMSAGRSISAGFATTSRGSGMAIALAGCRPPRGAAGARSRRSARLPSRSSRAVPALDEAAPHPATGGDGRWRLRQGLSMRDVESLCEEAGLGEALEVDRVTDLPGAARALQQFKRRDLYGVRLVALFLDAIFLTSGRKARRRVSFAPGASPSRASGSSSACASGCASPTRTGSLSQGS